MWEENEIIEQPLKPGVVATAINRELADNRARQRRLDLRVLLGIDAKMVKRVLRRGG